MEWLSSTNYLTNILWNIWKNLAKLLNFCFFTDKETGKNLDVFSATTYLHTYLLTTFHTNNHRVDSRQSLNQFELFELFLNIDSHCHFIIFLST